MTDVNIYFFNVFVQIHSLAASISPPESGAYNSSNSKVGEPLGSCKNIPAMAYPDG